MAAVELDHSTYLDWTSYRTTSATTPQDAFAFTATQAATNADTITVAFVINRVSDPASLLDLPWGERQAILASTDAATLWSLYGADTTTYSTVVSDLQTAGATVYLNSDDYVSSAESRTVWATLNASQFDTVFGKELMIGTLPDGEQMYYWEGKLSVESSWNIGGLWFDETSDPTFPETAVSDQSGGASVSLTPSTALGIGNSATTVTSMSPASIAELYNFPELGAGAVYGVTGLIEPEVGITYNSSNTVDVGEFNALLNIYLASIGVTEQAFVYTVGSSQTYSSSSGGERSLDVGIVAAVNPQSLIGMYAGSGSSGNYVATQQALWATYGTAQHPGVISSSYRDDAYPHPDSPFYAAYSGLFVDAALQNVTPITSAGDLGTGHETANGITNVANTKMSPYQLVVGGSSASTMVSAASDPTLTSADGIYTKAMSGDLGTLKMLISGGLKALPASLSADSLLLETVWNSYRVNANGEPVGFDENNAGSGGVDTSQPTPNYQTAYGYPMDAVGGLGGSGRGLPDVVLDAGGNMHYIVPQDDMSGTDHAWGTSAAAPMWAALTTRLNAIFTDQGLPNLGYMNDLLYLSNVIAPGGFNDVQNGNATSTYWIDGSGNIVPTGYGYDAGEGFDLASGLGSPNGLLLARSLTQIAHSQVYYSALPDFLVQENDGSWVSGVDQTFLVQPTLASGAGVSINGTGFSGGMAANSNAWSTQFAQQVMQQDFSSDLVLMFDRLSQGLASDMHAALNTTVSVTIGGDTTLASQGTLSSGFGFVDFANADGGVNLARPIAVAELAGGVSQDVEVRLRQSGMNDLSVMFYEVDDYSGRVNGLRPQDAGYAQAAASQSYQFESGSSVLDGPGYGQYGSAVLVGVDPGDLIAMRLVNNTTGQVYFAYSAANSDGLGHIWNYGLNTWGWEDTAGGGDFDYNDLVVQLDFTSAAGSGWLLDT